MKKLISIVLIMNASTSIVAMNPNFDPLYAGDIVDYLPSPTINTIENVYQEIDSFNNSTFFNEYELQCIKAQIEKSIEDIPNLDDNSKTELFKKLNDVAKIKITQLEDWLEKQSESEQLINDDSDYDEYETQFN